MTVAVEQVVLQLIGGIFRDVEQHEPRGPVACDLAAQLRADGAAAARNEDGLAVQELGDMGIVQPHRRPAQQVVDLDLAHGRQIAAGALGDGGERLAEHMYPAVGFGAKLQNFFAPLRRQHPDGEDDIGDGGIPKDFGNIVDGAVDGNAVDALMLLGGIVVHKAVGAVAALRLLVQIRKERGGGSARADDGGRCARGGMALRAYDPTSVDTVGEAVGQHDEQRDRRAGQRTGDPDIAHAGE